jgi:hypothetical protein
MLVVNTNENWEQKFIDRNVNKNINVFKLLKISNFGIYLKTNENYFLSNRGLEKDQIKSELDKIFSIGSSQATNIDYLIKPSMLFFKFIQYTNLFILTLNLFSFFDRKDERK